MHFEKFYHEMKQNFLIKLDVTETLIFASFFGLSIPKMISVIIKDH